jgi:hypothetical protein
MSVPWATSIRQITLRLRGRADECEGRASPTPKRWMTDASSAKFDAPVSAAQLIIAAAQQLQPELDLYR